MVPARRFLNKLWEVCGSRMQSLGRWQHSKQTIYVRQLLTTDAAEERVIPPVDEDNVPAS